MFLVATDSKCAFAIKLKLLLNRFVHICMCISGLKGIVWSSVVRII